MGKDNRDKEVEKFWIINTRIMRNIELKNVWVGQELSGPVLCPVNYKFEKPPPDVYNDEATEIFEISCIH